MRWRRSQPPKWKDPSRRGGNARPDDGLHRQDPHSLACWMDVYLEQLVVRDFAPHTITTRRLALAAFLLWCQDRDLTRPHDITRPILEGFQRWMHRYRKKNGNPLGSTTQSGRMAAIKHYFRWLARQNVIMHNPASELEMPRESHKLPMCALDQSEIERILSGPDIETPLGLRDRAMLEVLYSTAIRRSEAVHLDLGDVNAERGVLFIRQGKGHKDRVVPIGTRALAWLRKYLCDGRPELVVDPRTQALFVSGYGDGALHPDHVTRLVADYLRRAGITKGGCHLFRHTCATLMLENGADIRFIQQMLGHANLNTTQIYTHVSIAQLQRVHALTHPAEKPQESEGVAAFAQGA